MRPSSGLPEETPARCASLLRWLPVLWLGVFDARAAAADAMPVDDPASLLGLLVCVMVGGGAVAMRRSRP